MNPYYKVAFHTLGCKLNFAETSTIARSFQEAGYARVDFNEWADVYVINTCSVTDNADKKTKYFINKAKKQNQQSKVVIIGCYAQLKPENIVKIKGVDLVLGANEKFNVLAHLEQSAAHNEPRQITDRIGKVRTFIPSYSIGDRTRSFLKVQDGCDYYCSFCTIPLARGKSRNGDIKTIVQKAEEIASQNVKEIVLTGVNIGDFGQGSKPDFLDLIKELDQVEGIERFRISSIEPNLLTNEIIDFVAKSKKFMPHFHIPLQSGSDEMLTEMKRKYNTALYAERVRHIKTVMPHCCIGVDVIVGFPGESDEHFLETYHFLNQLEVSYLHVFTYSERANTVATKLPNTVAQEVRNERNKQLRILSNKLKRAFYLSQQGQVRPVLFEAEQHENAVEGFTDNYVRVKAPYQQALINTIAETKLNKINVDGLYEFEEILNAVHV